MRDSDNSGILDKKREQAKQEYKKQEIQERKQEIQSNNDADDGSSINSNISIG
jgi:hypothetical protein